MFFTLVKSCREMNSKLLSFFLFISFLNFAYPDTDQVKNLKISLQRSGFDNSNEILVAFKACFNVKETDRLYRDLLKSSFNINNKQLLKIQYAKTLNSFGSQIESVKIMDEVSRSLDKSSTIVKVEYYIVLGGISVNSESPVLAREYFQKALALLEGKNNNVSRMKCYTSLGMTFTAENKLDSAIVYFNKAGAIDHGESGLNSLYLKLNMAWMSSKLGEFESSKANFLEAIDLFTVVPDVFAELRTYGNLGDIYFEQDSIALAKMYYEKGLKMANKFGFKLDVFRFERSLGLSFAKESNYREASVSYTHLTLPTNREV